MNNSGKVWLPSEVDEHLQQALSVSNPDHPMDLGLYLNLLEMKLQALVDADPKAARRALEMSVENAPVLWSIAEHYSPSQWGSALVQSDQLQQFLPKTWQGTLADTKPMSLLEILELLG